MKPLITTWFLLIGLWCQAQETIAYFDAAGEPVQNKKDAAILQLRIRINDTIWEFNNYRVAGACIVSCRCRSEDCPMLDGRYISYDRFGFCDTMGNYVQDRREGIWRVYSQAGRLVSELTYENGALIDERDSTTINAEIKRKLDSLHADRNVIGKDADFHGGTSAWLNFLNHHLRYPDDAVNDRIQGTPIVGFFVDKDGHIPLDGIYMARSVAYSLDQASVLVIRQSPDWDPAVQDGRKVTSNKRQPIVFRMEVH